VGQKEPPSNEENREKCDGAKVTSETTTMSDACCQTRITVPMNFDLDGLLEKQFSAYIDVPDEGKELMISTLRRKLFEHDNCCPSPAFSHRGSCITSSPYKTGGSSANSSITNNVDRKLVSPLQARNLACLKSPSLSPAPQNSSLDSPALTPVFRHSLLSSPSLSPVEKCSVFGSPCLSPVSGKSSTDITSYLCSPCDDSPKHKYGDVSPPNSEMLSVGVSPIDSDDKAKPRKSGMHCSFMPDVSFDIDESTGSDVAVKESSRAIDISSPDVSPIQNFKRIKNDNSSLGVSVAMDSMALEISGRQSVKESTARNIHALSGIDMSSIGNGSIGKGSENSNECAVRIIETSQIGIANECTNGEVDICSPTSYSYSDESHKNDVTTTRTAEITVDIYSENVRTPETLERESVNVTEHSPVSLFRDEGYVNTPLVLYSESDVQRSPPSIKGILKHGDSMTPTRPMSKQTTSYGTICNSGTTRPLPCINVTTGASQKHTNINRSLTNEFNLSSSKENDHFDCGKVKESPSGISSEPVSFSAFSKFSNVPFVPDYSANDDKQDKENCSRKSRSRSPLVPSRRPTSVQNSMTISMGSSSLMRDDGENGDYGGTGICLDSGIGSMEWSNELKEGNEARRDESFRNVEKHLGKRLSDVTPNSASTSVTPLLQLNQLHIQDRTPWSARRMLLNSDSGKHFTCKPANRYSSKHSLSVSKSRPRGGSLATPRSVVSRTRARFRSESVSFDGAAKDYGRCISLLTAYKDLLPSPLK